MFSFSYQRSMKVYFNYPAWWWMEAAHLVPVLLQLDINIFSTPSNTFVFQAKFNDALIICFGRILIFYLYYYKRTHYILIYIFTLNILVHHHAANQLRPTGLLPHAYAWRYLLIGIPAWNHLEICFYRLACGC